jgi:hypothetical protein
MSLRSTAVSATLFLVLAWALSAPPAFAQSSAQELKMEKALAAECVEAKAQLANLQKSSSNVSEEIAATERQILLTCRPNLPPPPPPSVVVCGMDENGSGTGQAKYIQVYSSKYARWCVDETYWPANAQHISKFFAYYDGVVPVLRSLFHVKIPLPVLVEVSTPRPGGSVCDCGPIFGEPVGLRMTGDAFSNGFSNPQNNQSVPGFWGYLLPLHETINGLTSQIGGGGWPADWWADHRSPFPNAMDIEVMRYIGKQQVNQTLLNAASAQYERFADPSQPGYDSEVGMFVSFYDKYGGFGGYSKFFNLVQKDKLPWQTLSQDPTLAPDDNHSALLSEYVIAYLSLAFGTKSDLTPTFTAAGVGTKDTKIAHYSLSSHAVKGIGNAHCSIDAALKAGRNASAQLAALQKGNYKSAIASGGTRSSTPSECKWSRSKSVAKW